MAVNTKTIFLLTTDVKTRKLIGGNKETMGGSPKNLKIDAKVFSRRNNDMWDILLAAEDSAKSLAGNILTTKCVRLQTEYMGTRKTRVTLHGVHLFISEDHLGFFSEKFGEVNDVSAAKSKAGIDSEDVEIMVTVNIKTFMDIPNVLTFVGRPIYVMVESRRPLWR